MIKGTPAYEEAEDRLIRIFIRAQDSSGKWGSLSLNEVTDEQFENWFKDYLYKRFEFECDETVCIRSGLVEFLDDLNCSPVELKKGTEAE